MGSGIVWRGLRLFTLFTPLKWADLRSETQSYDSPLGNTIFDGAVLAGSLSTASALLVGLGGVSITCVQQVATKYGQDVVIKQGTRGSVMAVAYIIPGEAVAAGTMASTPIYLTGLGRLAISIIGPKLALKIIMHEKKHIAQVLAGQVTKTAAAEAEAIAAEAVVNTWNVAKWWF